ncbi:hypothetical protein SS37A_39130 (plasmid) [Methylocystis iwaonis]|uniref:ParB/Sulfiredoxin domain-containing protein n=1 Tax=Methylocystis iwaonis TaxID=2885079 RepID=A0ABM8EEG0_9HYPH|nr:hypothetical protein SS37A_39130 [Methylocystis iwaonis]
MRTQHIRLLSPMELKPHEQTDSCRVRHVIDLLLREQAWTRPICVEATSLCVMDGHHRRVAAIHLGLAAVPVIAFTYDEIRLGGRQPGMSLEPEELIDCAMRGRLFPPKSTRHVFPPFQMDAIPLEKLLPSRACLRAYLEESRSHRRLVGASWNS